LNKAEVRFHKNWMMMMMMIIQFNSIRVYLRANPTAQRPIIDLARLKEEKTGNNTNQ
jgi:hypothetical protein